MQRQIEVLHLIILQLLQTIPLKFTHFNTSTQRRKRILFADFNEQGKNQLKASNC